MIIIKVSNLTKNTGLCDYKGLNLDLIEGGTQLYPTWENTAYFYYSDDSIVSVGDITVIDQATYDSIKTQMENQPKPKTEFDNLKDTLNSIQDAIDFLLMGGM